MKSKLYKIIIATILFIIAIAIKFQNVWINRGIFIVCYLFVGLEVLKEAVENITKGKVFDENFLMAVATLGAFSIGEFPEAVAVMLFYQVGELFQDYAVDKSRKSISNLMDIRPDYANVLRNGLEEKVNPNEVKIGETIIIKPGEKIPLDGKVIDGNAMLDTKALTGESVPMKAKNGDEVLSGCINQDGVLKVEVTKEYDASTVNKILELVESASNRKAKSEKFITRFAEYYTPIVVITAVFLAIIPPLIIKNASFFDWIYRALSFLVVSCPCALVISIPLSFFGGIGGASKHGILVKGSNYLENLANVETVVFDKTGTLTKGVFEVQKIEPVKLSKEELLEYAFYLEKYSNHPIAKSIKQAYYNKINDENKNNNKDIKEISKNRINDLKEISGCGISGVVDEKQILIGNEKLMFENNIEYKKCDEVGTVLYISIDNEFAGYILISDTVKEDSKKAIKDLKKNGIKNIIMLTGDRKEVAEDVARKLGIDKTYSELLPNGKVEKIEELLKCQKSKVKSDVNISDVNMSDVNMSDVNMSDVNMSDVNMSDVNISNINKFDINKSELNKIENLKNKEFASKSKLAFAGDGINDAPVLALADIGIAMGGLGSDSAIEAADVVIMTDEPSKINTAIKISRKTMKIVRENIVFAIFVKVLVLVLSAVGLATMWEAVFADVGVSIIAIINSFRMLRNKM